MPIINLDTLYSAKDGSGGKPIIEAVGGEVSIFVSYASTAPSNAPIGMTRLSISNYDGVFKFEDVPNYIYLQQASGATTQINTSGLVLTEV